MRLWLIALIALAFCTHTSAAKNPCGDHRNPTVQLLSVAPWRPDKMSLPKYPACAKPAGIKGEVIVNFIVAPGGGVTNVSFVSGNQLLRPAVTDALVKWQFPPGSAGMDGRAVFRFSGNCAAAKK